MRKKIVAGNWKMNCNLEETQNLLLDLKNHYVENEVVQLMVAPPFTNLFPAVQLLRGTSIEVAAQNMHQSESGAYTGEVSGDMLKSLGVNTVILGHSERRKYNGENHKLLAEKANTALQLGMQIIFCLGESLEEREAGSHFKVVGDQLRESLFGLNKKAWSQIIIAYEPVWAIGTGKTASSDQAQEMHAYIRKAISTEYGKPVANNVSILYGGSVKPDNAAEIFAKEDVDGGLIGGASLKAEDFMAIAKAF